MFQKILRDLLHYGQTMQPRQWLILLGLSIIVGLFCLRGFGSRKTY
jgi:hypothetical protein